MNLTIVIIQFMELCKVVENIQYLPLLQLHSSFQVVVLDGRIVKFPKLTNKLFIIANKISDIANQFV